MGWWLPEPIDPVEIIQCIQFRRQSSMDTEELLIHHSSQRQRAEGLCAGIIHPLRVLVFACSQKADRHRVVSQLLVHLVAN